MNVSFAPLFPGYADSVGGGQQQQFDYHLGNHIAADAADGIDTVCPVGREARVESRYHSFDHRGFESVGFRKGAGYPVAEFLNFKMISAVFIGIFVAWLAGRGVPLMGQQPVLITGLLIGTVIGVAFMGDIPVGPLIAAGILSFVVGKG